MATISIKKLNMEVTNKETKKDDTLKIDVSEVIAFINDNAKNGTASVSSAKKAIATLCGSNVASVFESAIINEYGSQHTVDVNKLDFKDVKFNYDSDKKTWHLDETCYNLSRANIQSARSLVKDIKGKRTATIKAADCKKAYIEYMESHI